MDIENTDTDADKALILRWARKRIFTWTYTWKLPPCMNIQRPKITLKQLFNAGALGSVFVAYASAFRMTQALMAAL